MKAGGLSFNPRPREGGDTMLVRFYTRLQRFNPRPREGGDSHNEGPSSIIRGFQSTPPRRGRRQVQCADWTMIIVSIHAPAKGATLLPLLNNQKHPGFQSTPPRRGRRGLVGSYRDDKPFQSTPPRRGRPTMEGHALNPFRSFNPRPREGGDRSRCHY